jgi:tetratricopeptide (TPR) repeat protein
MDASEGRTSTLEYGFYHAELPSTQIDLSKSVAELASLVPRAPRPLSGFLRRQICDLLDQYARTLHSSAAYGAAAQACETALQYDPEAILPAYYLSREYYLIGAYTRAVDFTREALVRVGDPSLRADLWSNLGDAQTKLGSVEEAKIAYRASYRHDYLLNLRALSALTGP